MKMDGKVNGLRRAMAGVTLVEVMIASGLGSLVLAIVASLSMYGARSSVALLNYTDLDGKSRHASDVVSRELRGAVAVTSYQSQPTNKFITFQTVQTDPSNPALLVTNAATLRWNSADRTLILSHQGQVFTALTECDRYDFQLFQRTPFVTTTNLLFYPATSTTGQLDLSLCKLVNMSWKCSRTILARKVNTESIQAAQIVLRNKP